MYIMKQVVILLVLLGSTYAVLGSWTSGLRVKFDVGLLPGRNFFFNVPRTVVKAVQEGWNLTPRPDGPLSQLELYCPDDRILCALYNDIGDVSGLQIALRQDEFTDSVLDWDTQGFTSWTPPVSSGTPKSYWTMQQYFASEEYLQKSKEERLILRDSSKVLQENAVWVTGVHHELLKVSKDAKALEESIFTKQACIPGMGRHYYYNMSSTTECTSEAMYPWFPLVHSGELVATGFISFGKLPIKKGERDWFERPPTLAVKVIVPRGPSCLYDFSDEYGLLTMHIYYVERPWLIDCLLQ